MPEKKGYGKSVSLEVARDALADVLVDYDVPTARIVAQFLAMVAVYQGFEDA